MIKKESDILYCFAKEPWKKYTFTELKKVSKKKSRSYIENVLKKFVKDKIIKQEYVSHLPIYSLNLASTKARIFSGFVLEYFGWNKKYIPYNNLQKLMDKILYKNYIFLITGSYANEKQTKKSDIDIVILIEDLCESKKVYAELSQLAELNIPQIHLYVFKHSEYKEMLLNKENNYGKEIAKNCLILTEGQTYIKLIKEVMENGFNG
ncbi:MAG: nucleotidyltransferase domain-containing protein [Candidatus Nanoarchaeia archaeon]|nr:nucleotidyltransferase domain-containing protein [Candidatus Nanoarchaeia archaeon]MDD5587587.1 nucleotidyltransferase domain-containing protein [Candidatus Nanoarchaeia archaeon]